MQPFIWTAPSVTQPQGKQHRVTWSALAARFADPKPAPTKEGLSRWAPVLFRKAYRCRANVEAVCACVLDVDDGSPIGPIVEALDGLHVMIHSTWSATAEAPRWRVVVPLDRRVNADAYERVWRWLAIALEEAGVKADLQSGSAAQPYAVPGLPPSGFYEAREEPGALVDVAAALVAIPAPEPPAPYRPGRDVSYDRRVERARRYLAAMPPAIQGSGGSSATMAAAVALVRGFALEPDDALAILSEEYNPRCQPEWSMYELRHKVRNALQRGRMPFGKLAEAVRR